MRALRHLVPLLLLAACAREGPERVVERRTSSAPAPRGSALLRQVMLDGHNRARAEAGLAPLAWDDTLVASARAYAQEMARTGRFAHAEQPQGPTRQGETLWTGTRDAYAFDEMLGHWLAEKRDFNGLPVPQSSRTGTFGDVSHYSQIMWARSQRVGCAMASNRRDDFVVCRYSPVGNVFGERAF